MKTSNIKTSFTPEEAAQIPPVAQNIAPKTIKGLTEGHFSQVFSYETASGGRQVLRLGRKLHSFEADKYASEHFVSNEIPIPKVLEIGEVEPGLYYCISEFADGKPADQLSVEEFAKAQTNIEDTFAAVFNTNIADTSGWGRIDRRTGNGRDSLYGEKLKKTADELDDLKKKCQEYGVDPDLVDAFANILGNNMPQASPVRRLIHADLGFDNVIVKDGEVTAVIDWSGVAYGDWIFDYSRLEFWYPNRHTPALQFARRYGLDTHEFDRRWATCMADNALTTLSYVFKYEDASTLQWIKDNLKDKLDSSFLKPE